MRIILQQPVMYKCQLHFRYFFFVFHIRQIFVDFFEVFVHLWTDVGQSGGGCWFRPSPPRHLKCIFFVCPNQWNCFLLTEKRFQLFPPVRSTSHIYLYTSCPVHLFLSVDCIFKFIADSSERNSAKLSTTNSLIASISTKTSSMVL